MGKTESVMRKKRIVPRWCVLFAGLVLCVLHPVAPAVSAELGELMEKGKAVYDGTCVICHQPTGLGLSGSFPPLVAGAPFDADASITKPLEERGFYADGKMQLGKAEAQIDVVLNGIPGTRMFAFGHVLSDEDVAAVVTYIRNAWGNDTGEIITPEQVKPHRQQ